MSSYSVIYFCLKFDYYFKMTLLISNIKFSIQQDASLSEIEKEKMKLSLDDDWSSAFLQKLSAQKERNEKIDNIIRESYETKIMFKRYMQIIYNKCNNVKKIKIKNEIWPKINHILEIIEDSNVLNIDKIKAAIEIEENLNKLWSLFLVFLFCSDFYEETKELRYLKIMTSSS